MKKKKILFPVLFVIISLVIFTSFTEEAEANGRCEKIVTYYFLLGINMTDQEGGLLTQSDKTTFEMPDFGENLTIKGEPVVSNSWNKTDVENYFSNQKASNCTTSNKNAWCDPSDTECLNSGNGGGYLWEDCSTIEVDSSGNFVSVDGYTADQFLDFTIGAQDSEVTFTPDGDKYIVDVSRDWEQSATQEDGNYHNDKWMYQPLKVDVTYEYDCAEEAPKCNVGVVSGSKDDNFSGCGSHGYSVEYNKLITIDEFESSTTRNDSACGGYAKINASSIITFKEHGNLASSINPKEQFAGGGFGFGLNYSGSASWNYCQPSEQNQVICQCTKKVE